MSSSCTLEGSRPCAPVGSSGSVVEIGGAALVGRMVGGRGQDQPTRALAVLRSCRLAHRTPALYSRSQPRTNKVPRKERIGRGREGKACRADLYDFEMGTDNTQQLRECLPYYPTHDFPGLWFRCCYSESQC